MNLINLDRTVIQFIPESITRIAEVSDEDYFGEKYAGYVSNSHLKYLNPDEGGTAYNYANRKSFSTDSLELGSAVHRAVLEGDKFVLAEVSKPSGKLAKVVELAIPYYKKGSMSYEVAMMKAMMDLDYYGETRTAARNDTATENGKEYFDFLMKTQDTSSLIILAPEQREKFLKAIDSIKNNKSIEELLHPSNSVFNILHFSEDVLTGEILVKIQESDKSMGIGSATQVTIPVKCKIDNWTIDFDNKVITLNDLKTSSYPIQNFMGRWVKVNEPIEPGSEKIVEVDKFLPGSFQKWHYQRQMAIYGAMLVSHCEKEYNIEILDGWSIKTNMIVAETIAPFNAYSFEVTEDWLMSGYSELERVMGRLAWHTLYGFDKIMEFYDRTRETSNT